jgi:hypothetical protein
MKNFFIGLFFGLLFILVSATNTWNVKEVGRYQGIYFPDAGVAVLDTRTGVVRLSYERGKKIRSSWVGQIWEYDFFGIAGDR